MYEMEVLVSNSHVNKKSHMKLVSLINAMQDIEGMHIDNLGEFTKYFKENNIGIFLLYRHIDIIKRPVFGQKIKLVTYPYSTNVISGYRHIFIYDENNNMLAKSISFGAYVNLDTYKPERVPRTIIKELNDQKPSELMTHYSRKIDYELKDVRKLKEFTVEKSHIDRYGHVNNAFYLEFAFNALEEDIIFNTVRLEYTNSFMLGDIVKPYLTIQDNENYVIILKNQEEEINAVIEFSNK